MAKKTTPTDSPKAARAKRARKPQHYLATIYGAEQPVIVSAANHKAAVALLVSLKDATAADLIAAGKSGYEVIDASAVAAPVSTDAAQIPEFPAFADPA